MNRRIRVLLCTLLQSHAKTCLLIGIAASLEVVHPSLLLPSRLGGCIVEMSTLATPQREAVLTFLLNQQSSITTRHPFPSQPIARVHIRRPGPLRAACSALPLHVYPKHLPHLFERHPTSAHKCKLLLTSLLPLESCRSRLGGGCSPHFCTRPPRELPTGGG